MTDEGGEFTFELRVCQWAEREWPPAGSLPDGRAVVVARQLGTRSRRWDTIVVECDREALAARAAFGGRALDSDLLHVVRHAPAEWAWYRDALPHPGYPWRYVREAVHRGADRGVVETRKDGGRLQIRRLAPYPDWIERIVAVENKPDLDAAAARDLADQVHRDVALGLADEVWVATAATGASVEPVLLEDLPVEAGVLAVDPDAGEADVVWHPRSLDPGTPGTRIVENPDPVPDPADARDLSAARFEYADPGLKADKRLEVAERAYAGGWRDYVDSMRPDCRHFRLRPDGRDELPWCGAKGRHQTAAECRGSCPAFEPEPPAWRSRDWPIEGGPGRAVRRLLDRQRARNRPGRD